MLVATRPRNRIMVLLARKGWSIYELADQAKMAYPQVYRLAKAEQIPPGTTFSTLKKIAGALGVSIEDLENGEE
jgi:DNA-binding Xre family transcriptional regulator